MTFATKWGCFQYMIMPFGLKNAPVIFSRIVVAAFKDFIHKFLEVYFDDWMIFGLVRDHIENLHIDAGKVSLVSTCTEIEKMYILCTIRSTVGPCSIPQWDPGRPDEGSDYPRLTSSYISHATQVHIGTY